LKSLKSKFYVEDLLISGKLLREKAQTPFGTLEKLIKLKHEVMQDSKGVEPVLSLKLNMIPGI
jgi:hypothetical protein